jgi:hypothetical protein
VLGRAFAELVERYVRPGHVRLVYRSLDTATATGSNSSWWIPQQVAALAAGRQHRFWEFTVLFLDNQPREQSAVHQLSGQFPAGQPGDAKATVNEAFLEKIARQVPGLQFAQWKRDRGVGSLAQDVHNDGRTAAAAGVDSTPTIVFHGPGGTSAPIQPPITFADLKHAYTSVS